MLQIRDKSITPPSGWTYRADDGTMIEGGDSVLTVLFWTMRNSQLERYDVVPGFEMPRGLQRFGVRWEFAN